MPAKTSTPELQIESFDWQIIWLKICAIYDSGHSSFLCHRRRRCCCCFRHRCFQIVVVVVTLFLCMPANTLLLPPYEWCILYAHCVCLFMGFSSIFVVCNLIFIDEKKNWKIKVYTHIRSVASSRCIQCFFAARRLSVERLCALCVCAWARSFEIHMCMHVFRLIPYARAWKGKQTYSVYVMARCTDWGSLFNTCRCTMPYTTHAYTTYAYIIPRLIPVFSADFFSLSLWPSVALLFGPMHRHVNWTMIFIFERKEKSFSSIFTEHSTPFVQLQCSPKSKDFLFNSIVCVCAPLATRSQSASDRSVSLLLWQSHLLSRRASTFSSAFNYFFYEISMNCIILHM